MDQAEDLRGEIRRMRKAIEELTTLNELARLISSTMSLDAVIEHIIRRSLKAVSGQQGMITLVDELAPSSMRTLIRDYNSTSRHEQLHLNQNILGWMLINKKTLVSNDFRHDPAFTGVKVDDEIQSLLCVPLLVKSRLIGILALFNKKEGGRFTDDDARIATIIGTQSAQVLENARLYEQEQKKTAMEKDLVAAREVQMHLLPKSLPSIPDFQLAAVSIPALEVGGDFYDVICTGDGTCEVVIADVAGKGLPAALLATLGKGVLCSEAQRSVSVREQLIRTNSILRGTVPTKSFITMMLAMVRSADRTVTISNAGHCYPIHYRSASKSSGMVPVRGLVLSVADDLFCTEEVIRLDVGDHLVLYSDGIDEAQNAEKEFYGTERLQAVIESSSEKSADEVLKAIIEDVRRFSGPVHQSDDMTVVVIKAVVDCSRQNGPPPESHRGTES